MVKGVSQQLLTISLEDPQFSLFTMMGFVMTIILWIISERQVLAPG